ncbi:hypothetical protein NUW58_g6869 [Xylaria curta]|uniref:Uncharacterized protein n=1 Tax=Xylaria curta TaxID=42375 RepID=A0ACC1NNS3_9PEZI|nr:hypothetical protein NUW58_g6869 [Xylaria curta]
MKYVRKPFTLPPGPPSRVIIFLPETKGLREYANQLGLRTWGRLVDMAISMAFIAFGQHPDSHQDIRDQLVDAFGHGHRMYNPNEKIRERIARYNAPRSIRTAAGLVQWYLEERFPAPEWVSLPQDWDDSDDNDDDNNNDDNNNDNDETEYDGDTDDDGDANDS